MAQKAYGGVGGKARNGIALYCGVNGKARKVVKGYVGVNGKARQFWGASGWRREDDIPYNFYQGSAVVYHSKVHLLGGVESPREHYSWDGENWVHESTLPHDCILSGAIVWNDKIYIFGSATNYTYDVNAVYSWNRYQWTQEANTPVSFHGINRAHIFKSYIHLIGSDYNYYSQWRYDSKFDGSAWTTFDMGVFFYSTALFNDKIYLLGDSGTGGSKWAIFDGNSVTPYADWGQLPYLFQHGFALKYGDKIHMLGSNQANQSRDYRKNHYTFDGQNFNKASEMPHNFYYAPAVIYKNRIHIFGGANVTTPVEDNRRKHWSYGADTKDVWSTIYPNAEVSTACTVETNNGNRTPVTKVNDGDAIVFIATNSRGSGEGGNWFSAVCVAKTREAALLSAPTTGTGATKYTINGTDYYVSYQSTNAIWGGGTQFDNPLGLPVFQNFYLCAPNGTPTSEKVMEIIDMLGIQIKE